MIMMFSSFSSISLSSGMDTYITYKLQRTLRVYKFIIRTLFCLLTTQKAWKLDADGVGAGKTKAKGVEGIMRPARDAHSRDQNTRLYCDMQRWYKRTAITKGKARTEEHVKGEVKCDVKCGCGKKIL
jgi:sRNA-binding protein